MDYTMYDVFSMAEDPSNYHYERYRINTEMKYTYDILYSLSEYLTKNLRNQKTW